MKFDSTKDQTFNQGHRDEEMHNWLWDEPEHIVDAEEFGLVE
ncbi:hypothetical protein [Vibrio sinaloensis]